MASETRYIFVTGGVVSSLGKGIAAASLAALLKARGYSVKLRKLDPYLNVDPGTMSPYQHGEVFVTEDGAETDLDLGYYERFTDVNATRLDSVTAGKIYSSVISKERKGEYLGATIQVIPHVTNEIQAWIMAGSEQVDFMICEVGGTVGDIEGLPFLEAIRQIRNKLGRQHVLFIHVTLLPYLGAAHELKTKPTQHSVKELQSAGIQPDLLICRSEFPVPAEEKQKLSLFCNVPLECVFEAPTVKTIYEVPLSFHSQGLEEQICKQFGIDTEGKPVDLSNWRHVVQRILEPEKQVSIAIVGKYTNLKDAYKSIVEALIHGGIAHKVGIKCVWIDAEELEEKSLEEIEDLQVFSEVQGILVPGGFGARGVEGKIKAIHYARLHKIPYFGICFGMQMAVIEFARHQAGLKEASSTEFGETQEPLIGLLTEWDREGKVHQLEKDLGGTMRLGAYPCAIQPNTKAEKIYGKSLISERHRHRYEVNLSYKDYLIKAGLIFSGLSPDGLLPEMIELSDHPWFIAVQFHPEFKSRPFAPHPLFVSFIEAAIQQASERTT